MNMITILQAQAQQGGNWTFILMMVLIFVVMRSEERRVGKEC